MKMTQLFVEDVILNESSTGKITLVELLCVKGKETVAVLYCLGI